MTSSAAPPRGANLIDELPWIPVRLTDGSTGAVTIREAFHQAHTIREITGEVDTQTFAILRLLLAILYRVPAGEPITFQQWRNWYTEGLPLDEIDSYLEEFHDRFDLLDNTRPFFQVADLATAKGERKDVSPLIADLPSNNRLFTNRAGEGAVDLSFAEAARWLVTIQTFDSSGIKSGALGDPRVKGGKGYPIGVGWSGLLGGVFAQGATLRETLLLNLVGQQELHAADPAEDIPIWEEQEPDTAAERDGLRPRGPVRLYTWQSRRVRLFADDDRIVGCLVTNGDKLTPQNMQGLEPMTAWRYSEPQTKKAKHPTYMPREHRPGRALWRGVGALLPGIELPTSKPGPTSSLPPALTSWLGVLDDKKCTDPAMHIRLRAVGVVYGSNNSVVDEILDDHVILPIALLRERNRVLATQAEEAVRLADSGAYLVRKLAENLDLAAGGSATTRDDAAERAFAALDRPYRQWLLALDDDTDPLDAILQWKQIAREELRRIGNEFVAAASPSAWVGRMITRNNQAELYATARVEGWFLEALTNLLGKATRKDAAA